MEKKKKKKITEKSLSMFLFTVPATVLYCVFFIYPIIIGIMYSFTDWNGLSKDYKFIGLSNYITAFTNSRFQNAVKFNIRFTLMAVILIVGLSLILALIFNNSKLRCMSLFRGIYFFPAVLGMLVVGLIFNEIFYRVVPVIGKGLNIPAISSNILASKSTAIYGVLIVHVWLAVAMATVMLLAGLQSAPEDLYEAAVLDGANRWQKFRYITMPFLLPVLSVVLILQIKSGLTVYDIIVALTNGGPGGATESLAVLIYNHGFKEVKFSYAIAEAMILTIVICAISFIQTSISNKKKVY
ncbi:sugar ABC transporter permease [Parablautia intestinalis]|jgi:raffinose/stachyose/melibiose transport system permease protein|uniref:Sugar ABC transporter permease n=1 Tax=Parablautia intestinalis TaxID=2320100 RepID=A0A3A9B3R5_9FIRM|nr:sugar ABC transporter permease [Parablautia intestinalis]MCI8614992.1 sugar ABC transporter permease [Lachnospiraceae bacterium]MDE7046433.1 sugar ABC transporter permease [Lachnospiraceae bacterium]RKI94136.1 sugar ABC transporter permease [Parablautia intestinalis]